MSLASPLLMTWSNSLNDIPKRPLYAPTREETGNKGSALSAAREMCRPKWPDLTLPTGPWRWLRSEEHTSELQSQSNLVCRLLLEKKKIYTHSRPCRHTHPPSYLF